MNEKGFATILGLCLILALALVVKGIQESEGNHSYETADFQTETDLQNAAEGGIYKAAAMVKKNPALLPFNKLYPSATNTRKNYQHKFDTTTIETSSGSIKIDVWGERLVIKPYEVNYARTTSKKYNTYPFIDAEGKNLGWKICAFFSRAELTSSRTGGKLYRRAFGYFIESNIRETGSNIDEEIPVSDTDKNIIYFAESAKDDLYYMKENNPDRK